MGDIGVTQADRDAAATLIEGRAWLISSSQPDWCAIDQKMFREGAKDDHPFVQAFARHRQAAEKAQQERDAAYIEGKGGVIPGATVFVSLITGENMPCMSGDARDKLNPHKRRQFDDATRDLATAIRSQGHE